MFEVIPINDRHGVAYYVAFCGSLMVAYDRPYDAEMAVTILNYGLKQTPAEA